MKKIRAALIIVSCLLIPGAALAMEVIVEIIGPPELAALKPGIERTITARCLSRGVVTDAYGRLRIAITALGTVISYDAVLDTAPPRAFHTDVRDASALSGTIDEMITALFVEPGAPAVSPPAPASTWQQTPAPESRPRVKLPFAATSIAAAGERIWVSDSSAVYELAGEKATPVWKARGNNTILRIYAHEGDIIVLAKIMDGFQSFRIRGAGAEERWKKAVVPLGAGLISTDLMFDRVYGLPGYRWSRVAQIEGTSPPIPEGLDIISAASAEIRAGSPGPEVLSYDAAGRLVLSDGKSILWKDDSTAGITPLYIEQERDERGFGEGDPSPRYSLKPRIVAFNDRIVTFRNYQGMARMVSRSNLFESAQVLLYTPTEEGFSRSEISTVPSGYCTDIAVTQNSAAVLVVQDKTAFVQFIGL